MLSHRSTNTSFTDHLLLRVMSLIRSYHLFKSNTMQNCFVKLSKLVGVLIQTSQLRVIIINSKLMHKVHKLVQILNVIMQTNVLTQITNIVLILQLTLV